MDEPLGISSGRKKALQAVEDKEELEPVENPETIEDVVSAVDEISVPRVMSPPRETVETIESAYSDLPDEAKPHYLQDDMLLRRVNSARRQFNDWMGKRRRMAEMPSPVEAGRAYYPTKNAQNRSRLEQESREELEEKIDRVRAAARGGQQRALNEIGSSVGEQTKKERESQRGEMRSRLEKDDVVKFRNPSLQVGRVVRVNQKSVRVRYPNPRAGASCPLTGEEQPEETEDRIQLDSEYLELLDVDTVEEGEALVDK
ncbi:hypothetical protein [Natronolimnohabitans innermongolicus]|uniref:hypothetical protein n=1 Tax=Natronolimnohabitans innermongolicus TaxID=253107 RepID=UPI0012683629|nr:hypothetical protein [Natronolimnohabitans innermongolicus]